MDITVAIPTHDRRDTLLLAIRSALAQTRAPERVLVIADGCTDGTPEAVRELGEPRVEVEDLPKGPGYGYGHRNLALERAGDGAVAWLGDDDLWLPDHLERSGELLESGVADIVQSMSCRVGVDGELTPLGMDWRIPALRRQFLRGHNRTPMGAVSHLAAPARRAGGWNEHAKKRADRDLWQAMVRAGARSSMVASPTLLHFRGTGRAQSWSDRIEQNRVMLEATRDPGRLAALRSDLALAVHADNARRAGLARRVWWWVRTLTTP